MMLIVRFWEFRKIFGDSNPNSAESDGLMVAHLPPVDTYTCQGWYSEVGIDIDFNVHKCFGHEDGNQARFIDFHRLIDDPP